MSRQVYQLNNSDDEDYLSMDMPTAEAQPAAVVSSRKPKPIAATKPARSASLSRARATYTASVAQPSALDIDEDDDEVKPGKGKKLPLKSVQEHQNLINQLNAFSCSARFGPILKECGIVFKDLRLKSVAELRELRERVRACCTNSRSGGGIVGAGILGACGQMEAWAPARLMNLEGYQEAVAGNPEFASICEMIEIDSSFLSNMSPMQKMVLCLGTTAMSVSAANRAKSQAINATATLIDNLKMQQQQQNSAKLSASASLPTTTQPLKPVDDVRSY